MTFLCVRLFFFSLRTFSLICSKSLEKKKKVNECCKLLYPAVYSHGQETVKLYDDQQIYCFLIIFLIFRKRRLF